MIDGFESIARVKTVEWAGFDRWPCAVQSAGWIGSTAVTAEAVTPAVATVATAATAATAAATGRTIGIPSPMDSTTGGLATLYRSQIGLGWVFLSLNGGAPAAMAAMASMMDPSAHYDQFIER